MPVPSLHPMIFLLITLTSRSFKTNPILVLLQQIIRLLNWLKILIGWYYSILMLLLSRIGLSSWLMQPYNILTTPCMPAGNLWMAIKNCLMVMVMFTIPVAWFGAMVMGGLFV